MREIAHITVGLSSTSHVQGRDFTMVDRTPQNTVRLGGVSLPRMARRADKVVAQAAASPAPAEPKKFLGFTGLTWAKIVPLGLMFFSILFNYTILRDTKVLDWGLCCCADVLQGRLWQCSV